MWIVTCHWTGHQTLDLFFPFTSLYVQPQISFKLCSQSFKKEKVNQGPPFLKATLS